MAGINFSVSAPSEKSKIFLHGEFPRFQDPKLIPDPDSELFYQINCADGAINIRRRARMIDRVKLRVMIDKVRAARCESMAADLSMHKFRGSPLPD